MSDDRRILALIPARGGSKGLPRKNILVLDGHPLIAWSIAAGLQSETVSRVLCSTDDPEIGAVAAHYGAEVPFLRPAELAMDDTLDLPVFQHALEWLEREDGWRADIVVQLRPTSPLRFPGQVDEAVRCLLANPDATGVRAVIPAPANPFKMWLLAGAGSDLERPCDGGGTTDIAASIAWMSPLVTLPGVSEPFNMPRQALPQAYWQTGTVDIVRADVIRNGRMSGDRLLPLLVDPRQSVDIDTEADLIAATDRVEQLGCIRPDLTLAARGHSGARKKPSR